MVREELDGNIVQGSNQLKQRLIFFFAACETNEGKNVYGPSGTIVSPNYPNDYPDGADCVWNFKAPEGQVLLHRAIIINMSDVLL